MIRIIRIPIIWHPSNIAVKAMHDTMLDELDALLQTGWSIEIAIVHKSIIPPNQTVFILLHKPGVP